MNDMTKDITKGWSEEEKKIKLCPIYKRTHQGLSLLSFVDFSFLFVLRDDNQNIFLDNLTKNFLMRNISNKFTRLFNCSA